VGRQEGEAADLRAPLADGGHAHDQQLHWPCARAALGAVPALGDALGQPAADPGRAQTGAHAQRLRLQTRLCAPVQRGCVGHDWCRPRQAPLCMAGQAPHAVQCSRARAAQPQRARRGRRRLPAAPSGRGPRAGRTLAPLLAQQVHAGQVASDGDLRPAAPGPLSPSVLQAPSPDERLQLPLACVQPGERAW